MTKNTKAFMLLNFRLTMIKKSGHIFLSKMLFH